jgi:hypothetical protein
MHRLKMTGMKTGLTCNLAGASPYQLINMLSAAIIIMIVAWAALPVIAGTGYLTGCVHLAATGMECSTCGLSRSLSAMVSADYPSALAYNRNGPLLFAFFLSQLFLRGAAGFVVYRVERCSLRLSPGQVAWTDALVSILLFLACFRYLIFSL